MAIASMVLGIIALVCMVIPGIGFIAPLIAVVGLALGVVSKKQLEESGQPVGMAKAGMVMSIISLAISIVFIFACAACLGSIGSLGALS